MSSSGKTAIVWTCSHDRPEVSKERYNWLGKLIEDVKPDYTVDLGDGAEMASLNSFDTRNPKAIVAQNYEADVESYNESQDILWSRFRQKKKKRPYRIGFEGNHCLPEDTDVLTDYGWTPIKEVKVGDVVMSLSGWTAVQETHEVYYDGPMYQYGDRSVKARMTEGHRVYYYKSNGEMEVKIASEAPWTLDLPVSTVVGGGVGLTDAQLRFNAVALTDSYHTPSGGIVFYQSGDNAQVIRDILDDVGVKYREVVRDRNITHICGTELKSTQVSYEFHVKKKPYWCVPDNKSIPSEMFNLSEDQFEVLFETLIFCDGSIPTRATSSRVFYGRKQICEDLQALCVTKGYRATLTEYRENHWRVNICKTLKCRADKKVVSENYDDLVYCLTTGSGNFLMRQDNKPSFTGNCHRITRALEHDPRLEGSRHGISMSHLQHDKWFDEYHYYHNGAPAVAEYDGVHYAHYMSGGNMGRAISGTHHAYSLLQHKSRSCTVGHSHLRSIYFKDGAGSGKGLIGLVAGCYKGADEKWAGQANENWAKGVVIKRNVSEGMYDMTWVSMDALRKEYG